MTDIVIILEEEDVDYIKTFKVYPTNGEEHLKFIDEDGDFLWPDDREHIVIKEFN